MGTSNPVKFPAAPDMVGADEGGGEVVRVGVRFSGTGVFEVCVMDRPDMDMKPFKLSTIRLNAEDSLLEEGIAEACWQDLGGVGARAGEECQVCIARVCGAGRGWRGAVSRGLLSLVGPILCGSDKVGDARDKMNRTNIEITYHGANSFGRLHQQAIQQT
jgi:hypothetical protein